MSWFMRTVFVASFFNGFASLALEVLWGRTLGMMTDEAAVYPSIGTEFAGHGSVNHGAEEYVRTGGFHHTNTVESHFALLKRGIYGTFHNISEAHLSRYLAEFANNYVTTYAGLASAMIALVFLYWSATMFVYGGELNSAVKRARTAAQGNGDADPLRK